MRRPEIFCSIGGRNIANCRRRRKQLAIGAAVVGVALLDGMAGGDGVLFGGGREEAMFGGGGEDGFYASDVTGAASNFDSSGAGYISFDDGSSVSIGL